MDGYRTAGEIIAASGGIDGYLRQNELSSGVISACDELHGLIGGFAKSGAFDVEDYNAVKLIIGKISTSAREMASRIRSLEDPLICDSSGESGG